MIARHRFRIQRGVGSVLLWIIHGWEGSCREVWIGGSGRWRRSD